MLSAANVRPDITGFSQPIGAWQLSPLTQNSGALKLVDLNTGVLQGGPDGGTCRMHKIQFKASDSNAKFGKSQTNQMSSLRLLAIIKV